VRLVGSLVDVVTTYEGHYRAQFEAAAVKA